MILLPGAPDPPRFRERELGRERIQGEFTWYDPDNPSKLLGTATSDVTLVSWESMRDVVGHRKEWNNVQHVRETMEYIAHDQSKAECKPCLDGGDKGILFSSSSHIKPALPLNSVQEIINHPLVQHKLHLCLKKWHDGLYNFNAVNLPDVSIILMEDLPKLDGSAKALLQIAQKLAQIGRKISDLRYELERFKRKRNFTKVYAIQGEIAKLSSLYLGEEFAIKQNVRTAIECVAGVAAGVAALNFGKQIESFREIARFTSHDDLPLCPSWDGERVGQTNETVTVTWCITTVSDLKVRGSKLEQALAKIMAKVGVLPSLSSVWEAVPYSWLIDYVFRTGLLLRYVERANELGFSDLDLLRYAFSVKIERETEQVAGKHFPAPGVTTRKYEYYERLVTPDLDFPAVLQWAKLPHGSQWAKATAFFFSQFK